jgi:hypothetical protein
VALYGGAISARNQPGGGLAVCITLPSERALIPTSAPAPALAVERPVSLAE